MKFFFLAVFAALSINICFAQLAEERTAPFSAAKYEGGKLKVLVEKDWYELKAIDGVSTTNIINQCREKDDEDWMEVFSEDIVEVMQALGKPLKTQAKLSLYKNGTPITKTVSVTKEKRRAAREYHNTYGLSSTFVKDEHEATKKKIGSTPEQVAKTVNISMDKPFKFKSAKVVFNYSGHKLYSGKETIYIDDYGKTVVVITDKPGMMGQKDNKTIIWKNNKTTEIDHVSKTWQSYSIRPKVTEPPIISYSNETQRKQGGYVKKPDEKVLGKTCQVYEHKQMKVTYWLYKNLDLKMINYSMGGSTGYTKEPISFEEGITIPASVLKVPSGYKEK